MERPDGKSSPAPVNPPAPERAEPEWESLVMLASVLFAIHALPPLSRAMATGARSPPPVQGQPERAEPELDSPVTLLPPLFAIHAVAETSMARSKGFVG